MGDFDTPIFCVFLSMILVYVPSTMRAVAVTKTVEGGVDNEHPRAQVQTLDPASFAARAHAAHLNSLETFPFFAASVFAAKIRGAHPNWAVDFLSIFFVAMRALYILVYCTQTSNSRATIRSIVFSIGMAAVLALFIMALAA